MKVIATGSFSVIPGCSTLRSKQRIPLGMIRVVNATENAISVRVKVGKGNDTTVVDRSKLLDPMTNDGLADEWILKPESIESASNHTYSLYSDSKNLISMEGNTIFNKNNKNISEKSCATLSWIIRLEENYPVGTFSNIKENCKLPKNRI